MLLDWVKWDNGISIDMINGIPIGMIERRKGSGRRMGEGHNGCGDYQTITSEGCPIPLYGSL